MPPLLTSLKLKVICSASEASKQLQISKACTEQVYFCFPGRVACEISAADELLLTELILGGVFNSLTASQTCALLSCFVFDEKVRREIRSR